VSLHVQTNKQTNKNKLLGSAVSATVIRLWRNWSPSNGQQEHEKYKTNKMQADFRRDPPSHEACRITRIIHVPSATAVHTALLGKIKAIPFTKKTLKSELLHPRPSGKSKHDCSVVHPPPQSLYRLSYAGFLMSW